MPDEQQLGLDTKRKGSAPTRNGDKLHPSWCAFIALCEKMQHGDVERVRIQDGLPVLAELTRTKVKFTA